MRDLPALDNLLEIEAHIDLMDKELDILDPLNAIEAQRIEQCCRILSDYVELLSNGQPCPKPKLYLVS